MSKKIVQQQRTRTIRLPEQLDPDRIALIQKELLQLDTIVDLQPGGMVLAIKYSFPAMCFSTIWQLIKKHTGSAFGLNANLVYNLQACMETIEQQHLLSQCGWDIYVRDIFVASYQKDSTRRASPKRKPWQQVKRTDNPPVDQAVTAMKSGSGSV